MDSCRRRRRDRGRPSGAPMIRVAFAALIAAFLGLAYVMGERLARSM